MPTRRGDRALIAASIDRWSSSNDSDVVVIDPTGTAAAACALIADG